MIGCGFDRAAPAPVPRGRIEGGNPMLKSALLVAAGIVLGAGGISALQAQSNAPYYSYCVRKILM
jgi:hypothetical protein